MCVHFFVYVHVLVCKGQTPMSCLFNCSSPYLFEKVSPPVPGAHKFGQIGWPGSLRDSWSQPFQCWDSLFVLLHLSFLQGCWGGETSPHVFMAGTLPTEPFPLATCLRWIEYYLVCMWILQKHEGFSGVVTENPTKIMHPSR